MVSDIRNKKYRRDGARCDHAKSMLMRITSHDHDKTGYEEDGTKPVQRSVDMWKDRKRIH